MAFRVLEFQGFGFLGCGDFGFVFVSILGFGLIFAEFCSLMAGFSKVLVVGFWYGGFADLGIEIVVRAAESGFCTSVSSYDLCLLVRVK